MKRLVALFVVTSAFADNSSINLQMPSASANYQSDSFRAGDLDCSNAIGGSTNIEFGVTGVINNASVFGGDSSAPQSKDVGVYARIIIPLDPPKERMNCNTLYELELRKKRIEVQKLETELAKLKELKNQFEATK